MSCIYSHEGGAYCDKHDHGAVTVGCCGEESCPDREVLTRDDGYVLKSSVLSAIHNGDIDMGMVTLQQYRLLQELSRRIDRRIQSVPASDVAPVRHGRWKPYDLTYGRSIYYCTACNNSAVVPTALDDPLFNFCPNCGALMDKEVDNG